MRPQIDRANPIPDTFVFDGHLSRRDTGSTNSAIR